MSDTVEVITLIKTTLTRRGKGVTDSPVRVITEYWTMDGEKVMEQDPYDDLAKNKEKGGGV